jgi:GTP1/Obg family GTP-binding protein
MALELETIIQVGEVRVANLETLKQELKEALIEFQQMPITRENLTELKSARARLNKASESFNKRRVELGKLFNKPFDTFRQEVNSIISMIEEVSSPINNQIKEMEEVDKLSKEVKITEMFHQRFRDSKIPFEKYWDERYLNYTYSLEEVEKDIHRKFNEWHNMLVVIDKMDLTYEDKLELKAHYIQTLDIESSLRYISERNELLNSLQEDNSDEGEVVFKVIGSYEELKLLSDFLKKHKYNYKRLK